MTTTTLIRLDGVEKRFGDVVAVERLDLSIDRGEFVAIMGPSGCGKTTTLRMLAGLDSPTAGEVCLDGRRVDRLPVWERETPMVWQSLALFPFLSVVQNVEFGLRMRGVGKAVRRRRALEWLDRLGLADFAERGIGQLSGGQKQRVALARALVTEPPVLLLDEPLSALDAHLSARMQGLLKQLQRELGITFVYVTHSHSEAFSMADRVVIMNHGRIDQIGRPRDIVRSPASRFVARFIGGSTIFSGRVRAGGGDLVQLDTDDGVFTARPGDRPPAAGAAVDLIVPADRIALTAQTGWAVNEVSCRLMSEEFVGSLINLHLETAAGTALTVQVQQRDLDALEVQLGDRLVASWHAEDGHLLPAPSLIPTLPSTATPTVKDLQ